MADPQPRMPEEALEVIEKQRRQLVELEAPGEDEGLAWEGEEEREACIAILNAFSDYLRSRPDPVRDAASP